MKSFLMTMFVLGCILLAVAFVVFNTPLLTNFVMVDLVNKYFPMCQVEEFRCKGQKSQLPDVVKFQEVSMRFRQGTRVFEVQARDLTIHNFIEFLQKNETLRISSKGMNLQTEHVDVKAGQLKVVIGFKEWKVKFVEGAAFSQEFNVGPYSFSKLAVHLRANPIKISVFDIRGECYGGTVEGQVDFNYKPQFEYVLWSEFRDVVPELVTTLHPNFFQNITGNLSGSVRVVGGKRIDIFTIILKGGQGLRIAPRAFLMMEGVFNEEEVKGLELLDQENATLVSNKAVLQIKNGQGSAIELVFNITNAQDGLILKGKHPFRWNDSYESFLFPITKP